MITKRASAKINLSLDVISKREDNYHNIKTLMIMTDLYDELNFSKSNKTEIFPSFDFDIKDNLIYKAYEVLKNHAGYDLPFKVEINKNIPIAAGLAGGTSNGAATFYALKELYNLNISKEKLVNLAKPLGADFTYMMTGGCQIATGIGDKLEKVGPINLNHIILVNPGFGISTVEVYKNIKIDSERINFDEILKALEDMDIEKLNTYMGNKMERVVFEKFPEIKNIKEKLIDLNGAALMSGSGATVFSIFENQKDLDNAYNYFKNIYDKTYKVKAGEDFGCF
ncbi:4-(cytidine 5'-diphospho)-2-C-methyl-D-erythritol kinase [Peptoniphilus sp. MSJ-1]|uniref:4-diphosphocytidyl-2-C-methyl-D-erythritol kinase n=1 Tax=Peptoniphilus ovalis TaxID=2841503 RepID=A0ABS6FKS8_9FIRM|nr:4-(cytidine 5'-diphospho)-2-C-methyl-D-erythritol kinase [Peptoniphilus ovalis]MBU5669856.1 4-(cytidine 5'-diphospho)-2-C-methyl-D-erythritol kinase [Peptoniphilus ovalis]